MLTFDDFPSLQDLLEAVAAGDEHAQQSLYEKFEPVFQRTVKHLLRYKGCANPEDDAPGVASVAWRKTFQNIGKIRNPASFVSWVSRIIENEVNAHLARCIKKQAEVPLDDYQNEPAAIASAADVIINAERVDKILALAKTIHPKLPEILILRLVEGLGLDEIAPLVDESYGNVRTIYSRGLGKLRPLLEDEATMTRLVV